MKRSKLREKHCLVSVHVLTKLCFLTDCIARWNRSAATRIQWEVQQAIAADPMYGPRHDQRRHLIGVEYEVMLEERLKEMGESGYR